MKSVDENTPLKLAEAGRVGAPDDDVEVQGREPWLGRWKRSRGAAALTVTLLALGACVASAVTATNAPFDAVSLGAGRNHVHRVGDDVKSTRSAGDHKRQIAKDRSHKTRGRGRRHVPRLGKDPSSDYEIDVIDVIELDEDEAVEAFEATEPAPEMDPFDVTVLAEAPEPAPEMDPFDVTVLAEAPEPAKLPEESIEAPVPIEAIANAEQPYVSEQPAAEDPSVEIAEPTEEVLADVSETPEAKPDLGSTDDVGALGELPSDPYELKPCPNAFFPPRKSGSVEESRVSATMEGVLKYADKVYILCTSDCDDIVVPADLYDRVTMVDGYALDECNSFGSETKHWEKASQSHRAAMLDGFNDPNVEILAILEQDTLGDPGVTWEQEKWYELEAALDRGDWNLVRLSYRPYDFEAGRGGETCPSECECEVYSSHMCLVRNPGCALQSSDAYFIHQRAHAQVEASLSHGGVIDYHTFKEIGGHFLITPALTYQQSFSYTPDYIAQESMKESIDNFLGKCSRFEYFASDSQ